MSPAPVTRQEVARRILSGATARALGDGAAFAPANIALCKYWGKRNEELNLPVTSSLSVSLGEFGSKVALKPGGSSDQFALNGETLAPDSPFARRAASFLDLFRPAPRFGFAVSAENTIPTAAGFASSASGFAALTLALNRLFGWQLDGRSLSILARLGSGSAARSVFDGFVEWHAGQADDGMDSYAERLPETWPELRMGLLVISGQEKVVGSRPAMKRTVETSPLYAAWPAKATRDIGEIRAAIRAKDFDRLGRTAESNALAMHATMIAAWPTVLYWLPESVAAMQRVTGLRGDGVPVYFTMDAGPNLKLIFESPGLGDIRRAFPSVQVVTPFGCGPAHATPAAQPV